jgi:Neprosin
MHCQLVQFPGNSNCVGASGLLNVWDPYVDDSADPNFLGIPATASSHSDMQVWLQNFAAQLQSVEAAWLVDNGENGDYLPHLATYYTTNGYTEDGDNLGGMNQDVAGWVQIDQNIFPGALITGGSSGYYAPDAPVLDLAFLSIQFQLIGGFWLLIVNGTTIGGYPASLFFGDLEGSGLTLGIPSTECHLEAKCIRQHKIHYKRKPRWAAGASQIKAWTTRLKPPISPSSPRMELLAIL